MRRFILGFAAGVATMIGWALVALARDDAREEWALSPERVDAFNRELGSPPFAATRIVPGPRPMKSDFDSVMRHVDDQIARGRRW